MPSPVGHALAGLTVGWLSEPAPATTGRLKSLLTPAAVWCAVVAAVPDADLLIPHFHRTATHSLSATVIVFSIAMVVTGKVTRRATWGVALALAAAHGTHLLLDWLGQDRFPPEGIQVFWPFSRHFFISGVDLFPPVERRLLRPDAIGINARALLWEVVILGPIAALAAVRRLRGRPGRRAAGETSEDRAR
jgi:membrane-bound metal-dependent hydrolase YbcI (DUF457 family)